MPELAAPGVCTGCAACVDACPADALMLTYNAEGFLIPIGDDTKCFKCGRCEMVCPVMSPEVLPHRDFVTIPFGAWSLREEVRIKSASGGVFAELACTILAQNGAVAGAMMNGNDVIHTFIESADKLHHLQGSKYLQSNTAGIYRKMVKYLQQGKKVLFSGTPCQVAGALSIAKHSGCNTEQLYTCDLVCHGVPSYLVFKKYIESREKAVNEVLSFRDKEVCQTNSFAMRMRLSDGDIVRSEYPQDPFLFLYLLDLVLRKVCCRCPFAKLSRDSDITLGDFWGAKSWPAEYRKGLSLILIHSAKGMDLVKNTPHLKVEATSWEEALPSNPRVYDGLNIMGMFPSRRMLSMALKYLSFCTLLKLYANKTTKKDFWWFPYKMMFILYLRVHMWLRRFRLKRILKAIRLS